MELNKIEDIRMLYIKHRIYLGNPKSGENLLFVGFSISFNEFIFRIYYSKGTFPFYNKNPSEQRPRKLIYPPASDSTCTNCAVQLHADFYMLYDPPMPFDVLMLS